MASQDVAPILAREFVLLKLDFDRAKGAKEIEKRYIDKEQGLPWFAFLDGDGKAIVHSTGPKGNTKTLKVKRPEICSMFALSSDRDLCNMYAKAGEQAK